MLTPSLLGDGVRWIRSPADLAGFRSDELALERIFAHLGEHGASLHNYDIGAGKTYVLDALIEAHRRGASPYDLVIYLASEWVVLSERPAVREVRTLSTTARATHDVAVLVGRPRERCGPRDASWRVYERAGCGALGRELVCGPCTERPDCEWPTQFSGEALRGRRVICATQAQLSTNPSFVPFVVRLVGASRVLVILDEAPLLERPFKELLRDTHVERSLSAFQAALREKPEAPLQPWIERHQALLDHDVPLVGLPWLPPLAGDLAVLVQRAGLHRPSQSFRFLGHELTALSSAPHWRSTAGDGVYYLRRPVLKRSDYLIAAAGVPVAVARRHLGLPDLQEFAPGVRLLHENTEVYNLRSSLGSASNFQKNAPQILDAFGQLIARRAETGHRTLVVVKKPFVEDVARQLQKMLREFTQRPYRVLHNPAAADAVEPWVVPLLHYGVRGVNTYEDFDTALALSSYNARADLLETLLNDPDEPGSEVHVEIISEGRHRRAIAPGYWAQQQGYGALASDYQQLMETVWAEQALGRVRFTVRARLVVFFQTGPIRYPAKEFSSLEELRQNFGLRKRRDRDTRSRTRSVETLAAEGKSAATIAEETGLSVRTVYRHLSLGKGDTKPIEEISPLGLVSVPSPAVEVTADGQ